MKRRTVLRSLAALVAVKPLGSLELFAQSPTATDKAITTLKAVAEVVLPSSLGVAGREAAVQKFVAWTANYREGAERGGGYGNARLSPPTGSSPAAQYPAQFDALDRAAVARGARDFAALALPARREIVEAALNVPQRVTRLPSRPTGQNLIADFMGYYFNSEEGFDLAYKAAIGRDSCRSLDGSDKPPAPRGGR